MALPSDPPDQPTDKLDTGGPSTPPQKATKRHRDDKQTRSADHGDRQSPAHRYLNKGSRPTAALPIHPLSLPLNDSHAYDAYDPHNDEGWSPIEDHSFFRPTSPSPAPAPSPVPSEQAPSPSPSTSAPSPSPSVSARSPSPSPSVTALSRSLSTTPPILVDTPDAPPSPSLTAIPDADDPMDTDDTVFREITREAFMAKTPAGRNVNPHRPLAAHDPDKPTAIPQYTTTAKEKPETVLGLVVFCYGGLLASKFSNIHAEILCPLEEVAGKGKVTLIRPQVKEAVKAARRGLGNRADKFPPPIALIARCDDPEARSRLTGQVTFAATPTVAFHVVTFDPARLSWAFGFFQTDISDLPEVAGRRLAYAVYDTIRSSPPLFSMFDRAMQGGSKISREQRLLDWALTFDVRFLPHDKTPVYVLFRQPCTEDPLLWDTIRAALRITYTDDLEAFKPHANAHTGHNLCADCKYDDHPCFNCLFTKRDKAWWGPKGIKELLAELDGDGDNNGDDGEGDHHGAPRGRVMTLNLSLGSEEDISYVQRYAPQTRLTYWLLLHGVGQDAVNAGMPLGWETIRGASSLTLCRNGGILLVDQVCFILITIATTNYNDGNHVPNPRYGNLPTDGFITDTATGNSGTGGGGSSATGTRPTDDSARSGGEMADAGPISGRVDTTPGAVCSQGGTSTSDNAHPTHSPIQRRGLIQGDRTRPYSGGNQLNAEGGSPPLRPIRRRRPRALSDGDQRHAEGGLDPWETYLPIPDYDDRQGPAPPRMPPPLRPPTLPDEDATLPRAPPPLPNTPAPQRQDNTPPGTPAPGDNNNGTPPRAHREDALQEGNPNPWHPQHKWYHVNQLTKDNKTGLLVIVESHLSATRHANIQSLFGRRLEVVFSEDPISPNAKGVAFVLNKDLLDTDNLQTWDIIPGRAMLIEIQTRGDEKLAVLGVYAPNVPNENAYFWEALRNYFRLNPGVPRPDMMAGDMNIVEEAIDRLPCHTDLEPATTQLDLLLTALRLVDGWRKTYPTTRAYTYAQIRHGGGGSQSRIDRIYIQRDKYCQAYDW
ncbi:hypothetical protein C8R44DRAFT_735226 [Mycena epipterygia]|nr:hypothetical protein C8R44DRAFT_735226 [Mycena epipterygia]